ncbi:MAG: hypothetical protein M3R14_12420 [Acidobacteriota bacterium]|nr:hypothetical protein [Acidobacteriota bacterium]
MKDKKAKTFAKSGREGFLRLLTAENSQLKPRNYARATAFAVLGKKDRAFAELNAAFETHDFSLTLLKIDPCLDSLRDDSRFQELLRKVGFPP